jgi:hypothetical protein
LPCFDVDTRPLTYIRKIQLDILERSRIIKIMAKKRKNPYAVALGRKGGKRGGPARAANMTPEQRSESARHAVMARWANVRANAADREKGDDSYERKEGAGAIPDATKPTEGRDFRRRL